MLGRLLDGDLSWAAIELGEMISADNTTKSMRRDMRCLLNGMWLRYNGAAAYGQKKCLCHAPSGLTLFARGLVRIHCKQAKPKHNQAAPTAKPPRTSLNQWARR